MKLKSLFPLLLAVLVSISPKVMAQNWIIEKHKGYRLSYKVTDEKNIQDYNKLVENGIKTVQTFFHSSYPAAFDIFIHPNRASLDSTWQKDWNMPDFKSECWMVASGVATKLDMISPKMWDQEACEHTYAEMQKTQQLITHELVHVYHGQLNASPDFSNVEGIDWFVEGLATYASGQCDSSRIAEIKKAIAAGKIPDGLDNFWTGKLKYGLSGSVVMYLDHQYGRDKLKALLPFSKKAEILSALGTTETALLGEWKNYIQSL